MLIEWRVLYIYNFVILKCTDVFIYPLLGKQKFHDIMVIGKSVNWQLEQKELELLQSFAPSSCYSVYPQLYITSKNRVITTCSTSKATKRIDYCISYRLNDNGVTRQAYGLLQKVVMATLESYCIVISLKEVTTKLSNSSLANVKLHDHYIAFSPQRFDLNIHRTLVYSFI